MTASYRRSHRQRAGFTLIELLVVVAIIALLISILLPSLSRAREQARTTLCGSRLSQLVKAILLYCDDYNEMPPFVAKCNEGGGNPPDPNETWLASEEELEIIHDTFEADWDGLLGKPCQLPRSGDLFPYTRFENLYLCPEFERLNDSDKSQNRFNYTRAIWCRYWVLPYETGWDSYWGDIKHIMKPSQIHSPALVGMLIDEQWDRFCAVAGKIADWGDNDSPYNRTEYCFFADNNMGYYHGQPVTSSHHELDHDENSYYDPFLWKRGSVGFYDGHVELWRDPWPTQELGNNKRSGPFRMEGQGKRGFDEVKAIQAFMSQLIFAQRGFDPGQRYLPVAPF